MSFSSSLSSTYFPGGIKDIKSLFRFFFSSTHWFNLNWPWGNRMTHAGLLDVYNPGIEPYYSWEGAGVESWSTSHLRRSLIGFLLNAAGSLRRWEQQTFHWFHWIKLGLMWVPFRPMGREEQKVCFGLLNFKIPPPPVIRPTAASSICAN